MSSLAISSTANVAATASFPSSTPRGNGPKSLLPTPTTSFEAGAGDAMSAMYILTSKRRAANTAAGATKIEANRNQRSHALDQEKAALQREREAAGDGSRGFFDTIGHLVSNIVDDATDLRLMDVFTNTKDNLEAAWNSPNFWSDIESGATAVAQIAAVVGAAAVSVVTLGAGTPLLAVVVIGVAMSAASMADSQFHILEKLGVDADTAAYIDLGLAVGGAALTFGGGLSASAGAAASSGSQLMARLGTTAVVAGTYAKMAQGTAQIQTGGFKADAKEAQADGKAARFEIKRSQRIEQMLIQGLAESAKSGQRALETLQGAMTTQAQTIAIATMRV